LKDWDFPRDNARNRHQIEAVSFLGNNLLTVDTDLLTIVGVHSEGEEEGGTLLMLTDEIDVSLKFVGN
jgi:hypothetical protein